MYTASANELARVVTDILGRGIAIPAHPLALTAQRKLDERRQRALSRYYIACGAGGLAVGVHTTQFAIRHSQVGLFRPVLELASEEMDRADVARSEPVVRIGGICGDTKQALSEAELLRDLRYHAGLLNLGALSGKSDDQVLEHCRLVSQAIPIIGFYLQPSAGGRHLSYTFWRRYAELPGLIAVKIAPFNRYQTLDVIRAMIESGRDDVALYTGNDDNIVQDLLAPYRIHTSGGLVERRIVGGLLGHWSVWTKSAVELYQRCREVAVHGGPIPQDLMVTANQVTDTNAAFFDAANWFRGCTAGLHEVLRRQGLMEGIWCLDPEETLGPGQSAEIDRVLKAYPNLCDDEFVESYKDEWLNG